MTSFSSGAIATARQFINSSGWDNEVTSKQALSAIGQPKLMQLYNEVFSDYELRTAQCLMTYRDFEHPESKKNTENTKGANSDTFFDHVSIDTAIEHL